MKKNNRISLELLVCEYYQSIEKIKKLKDENINYHFEYHYCSKICHRLMKKGEKIYMNQIINKLIS